MSHDVASFPPPPPQPPVSNILFSNNTPQNSNLVSKIHISETDCKWAIQYPELRLACVRFDICKHSSPYKSCYKHIESLLQEGPTCGLVAISMVLNQAINPNTLLDMAKESHFSNNGEMFCTSWMSSLLDIALKRIGSSEIHQETKKARLYSKETLDLLLQGCLLLVPYDCDKNHTPCLKRGHKAHWAVITGVIITKSFQNFEELSPEDIYVTAKHGKSLHVAVWRLHDLDISNNNLEEFSPEKEYSDLEFVLPQGCLIEGLKRQFIVISF